MTIELAGMNADLEMRLRITQTITKSDPHWFYSLASLSGDVARLTKQLEELKR